jgi:hypothetical protein
MGIRKCSHLSAFITFNADRSWSRPVISKLLSIETGAYTFKDDPGANILAVVGESFDFIVPATGKKPLAMLELALDSQCTCFVDERTSPDNRSDNGEDVQVFIETAKRGYQVYQGTRNALDSAILVLPRYDQGESFAEHASRSLQLVMPQSEGMSANIQTSSRAESRSFRMLAHGMVDVDMEGNSEPESDVVSISNASSIIGTFTESGQRKVSRSRTRQSSRVTEAKLKEAHREMPSKPAASGSQLSLRHGDRQELANQSRSIDPRMLTRRKSNNVQTEMTKDIGMDTGFERYVEQSKDRAENKPARHAKLLHQPSAGLRPDTISSQRVESSPSNRAHRLLSSKRALDLGTNQTRPLRQPLEPERSLVAGRSTKETSEHRRAPQPCTGNEDLEPIELVNKTPAKTTTDLVTQARKTQAALRHTRQSQSATANPMDWNGGDMADESNAHLPAAKKPRLTEATAKSKSRQSLSGARSRAEPTKLDDSGATSILKRPKATKTKSRKSQQTDPKAKHDEFDIEDDEETTAPTSTTGNVAREQGRNAAGKNVKSQASKPAKGAATKPAVKGRKTLQSMDTNKTLAANRPRRSQPKSKKHIDESDSDIENPNGDAEDIPEKTKSNTMAGKRTSIAEHELQEPAVEATLSRQSAEASAKNTNSKLPDQAQSDHEVALAPRIPIQVVAETTEIATTYETLVTASPTRLDETEPQTVGKGRKNAGAMRDAKQQSTQPQETSTRANEDDSPDETAEDSYPKVTTKSQGARVSFGSKLGQFIKPVGGKKDAIAAHITPLSNAKSFVGAVNKTRSTSPKKPRQPEAASISKDNDTGLLENAESTTKDGSSTVSGKGTVPKVHTNEQAAAPSPKNASITNGSSNSTPGPRTAKQHMQRARLCSLKKLPKDQKAILNSGSTSTRGAVGPVTPSVAQQNVEFNDATLGQEDVDALHEAEQNHEIQEEFQLRDRNTPIDLTQDSDEAMSVTGIHQLDHVPTISKVIDNKTTTEARVIEEHDRDKTPAIRQGELVSEQPTQSTRAKLAVTERGTFEKTPQQPKLPHIADPPRRRDPTAVQNELTALRGSTTKKSQLVHFNTQGPQNQGVPSPEKPNRKSAAIQIDTSEAKENVAYKHSRFAAARRNPLIKVPTPQSESTDSADEDYDESGFVVEDDTVMEDVGDAVREGRANPMPEESATVFTSRLLPQGSQSSRVDHNGSPRLSPSHLNHSTQLDDHDMNVAAEFTNENNNVEDDDPTAWTEKSATESEEYASQDSDQYFRLSNKAPNPRQSDRTIRSRTQATATAIPSSKPVEQAERKPAPANMSIKSTPRESLGLSHMVQEQYPQAQKNVATHPFKKPLLRTEVANQLEVARLPITGHKAPAQADNLRRQPLKEVSTNSKKPTIADEPPPNFTTEFSSAEPIRFNKPQSKTPRQPYPASETQEETPASLMTTLHVHRADRLDEGEETIRESLNRRKRQSTKDADRTLVEDNNISQYDGRQVDETSSVDSVSPPSEADINTDLRQDDVRWREGSRKAQNGVRDALMEIANVGRSYSLYLMMLTPVDCPYSTGKRRKID